MRMKVYEIDGTFLGSIDSNGYPKYNYDCYDQPIAWIEDVEEGMTRRKIIWSMVKNSRPAGQVKPTYKDDKKAGVISPEYILLDSDGNFWRYVGRNDRDGAVQILGWMAPPPSDPFAVAGAAYFFTRSVFFFRDGRFGIYRRDPLCQECRPSILSLLLPLQRSTCGGC